MMAQSFDKKSSLKQLLEELRSPSEKKENEEIIIDHHWDGLRAFQTTQCENSTRENTAYLDDSETTYFHFCGMDKNAKQCTTWFLSKPTDKLANQTSRNRDKKKSRYGEKLHIEKGYQNGTVRVTSPEALSAKSAKKRFSSELEYSCGSLVWAKVPGYSMWPGMIDEDPDYSAFYWMYDTIPPTIQYHVVFFDETNRLSRFWCSVDQLKPFSEPLKNPPIFKKVSLLNRFVKGVTEAEKASLLNNEDRLKKYGFKVRLNSPGIKLCED